MAGFIFEKQFAMSDFYLNKNFENSKHLSMQILSPRNYKTLLSSTHKSEFAIHFRENI